MTSLRATSLRRTAVTAAVLVAVAAALGVASPAYATTGITAPGNGVTYAADTTVRITASLDANSGSATLQLRSPAPGSTAQTVDSASSTLTSGATLHYFFDTATCATYPHPCSGQAEARNGAWTVTLVRGGSVVDSSTFTLRIPPRAPASLSGQASGSRTAVLSWPKGDEPDLTGWTVYGDGAAVGQVGTDVCSGTTCSTTLTYGRDGTGSHTYSLVAHRSVAPGSSDTLDSPHSPPASVTLSGPQTAPTPTSSSAAAPSGSGSTSSGGAGTSSTSSGSRTSPGTSSNGTAAGSSGAGSPSAGGSGGGPLTVAQRQAFALSFQASAPTLGIPALPPLPDVQPAVAPLADGTYQPTLGYRDVVSRTTVAVPARTAVRRLTGATGTVLDSAQFVRSLAGALVLLLLAAHLRRWLVGGPADR